MERLDFLKRSLTKKKGLCLDIALRLCLCLRRSRKREASTRFAECPFCSVRRLGGVPFLVAFGHMTLLLASLRVAPCIVFADMPPLPDSPISADERPTGVREVLPARWQSCTTFENERLMLAVPGRLPNLPGSGGMSACLAVWFSDGVRGWRSCCRNGLLRPDCCSSSDVI